MSYQIEKNHQQIITVTYQGKVGLQQRMAAVDEACGLIDNLGRAALLIDVRNIEMNMTMEEQERFGRYLPTRKELENAKIAVLHPHQHNPNNVIDSYAYINGYRIVAFSEQYDAVQWLLGGLK